MADVKILVIDDEEELLDLLQISLRLEGYEVIIAQNGKEGLEKFEKENPDLVLCDIIMPEMDGFEVLTKIRQNSKKWVPVIMFSATTDSERIQKSWKQDADFYLPKPVNPSILSRNIKTLLNMAKDRIQ